MLPFDLLFPQLACEYRVLHTHGDANPLEGRFVFRELYCADHGCDCRRGAAADLARRATRGRRDDQLRLRAIMLDTRAPS